MPSGNARGLHERRDVVGEQFGGVGALRLSGQAGAAQVHGVAGELLGVLGDLERVTRLVDREIRNEDERFARAWTS